MNKILENHFQKNKLLSTKNTEYHSVLDELFLFLTRNDHVDEDVTVRTFLPNTISEKRKLGVIVSKSSCVASGIEEVMYLVRKHTRLVPESFIRDGDTVSNGAKILSLEGTAKDILAYERAILNILQRMSGIATETKKYVEKVEESKRKNPLLIAATRKTPWMHLDKKAVAVGGGVTHRLDLHDGILLKDNHLEVIRQKYLLTSESDAVTYAIEHAAIANEEMAVEIEVKTDEAVFVAIEKWKKRNLKNPFIVMLDNFSPERIISVISSVSEAEGEKSLGISRRFAPRDDNGQEKVFFEASGGITLDNVEQFAKTGVDVISIGALTHSPKAADLSLDLI